MLRKTVSLVIPVILTSLQIGVAQGFSDSLSQILLKNDLSLEQRIVTMGLLAESKYATDITGGIQLAQQALTLTNQLKTPDLKVSDSTRI